MYIKNALLLLLPLLFVACKTAAPTLSFAGKTEQAHHKTAFLAKKAIQFDIKLNFGGKEKLNGTLTLQTDSGAGLIEKSDGEKIYFIGDKVYCSPETKNTKGARFAAYTWSYFFLFPYKLSDPGTQWTPYTPSKLNDKDYDSQKLTFATGTGDAPDDWYIAYADKTSHLLEVGAYIVTAGGTVAEAEEDPHAIKYEQYKKVNGIPIATHWTFWAWRKDGGLTKQLGDADLSNIKFVDLPTGFFKQPAGYLEI